jgi:hypothetical protein
VASASADAFAFKAPTGAGKVDVKQLVEVDEIPPRMIAGEKNDMQNSNGFAICNRRDRWRRVPCCE